MADCAKREYRYWLPDDNGNRKDYTASSNSIVIIGPNGSGKSKLGAWIEQQDFASVHRVGSQRNLNFSEHVPLKSYTQAENRVFYGQEDSQDYQKGARWEWGKRYTTKLLDDFDDVLSAVIAQVHNEDHRYREDCKLAESRGEEKPPTRPSVLDKLIEIWESVLPHRKLYMDDGSFFAQRSDSDASIYSATQMSDGERSVLYLAAQVLCVPDNKTIIMDEPELHLHPSLMNRLWRLLEENLQDCLFVYISHDVKFAALHPNACKVWVKSFDGANWDWCFIDESDLPESLLIDLMGNRRPVLFIEGDRDSLDYQLYSALYQQYYVVPRGGCEQVIQCTKAFAQTQQLHNYQAFGIVDCDYKRANDIEALKKKNIYCLGVAEIENLFMTEKVVRFVASYLGQDEDAVFQKVKRYVIHERFSQQIETQVRCATISRIKTLLSSIEITASSDSDARESLAQRLNECNYELIYTETLNEYNTALNEEDYETVLKLFNETGVSKTIGQFFNHDNKDYCPLVIRLLNGAHANELSVAFHPYVPKLPDQDC